MKKSYFLMAAAAAMFAACSETEVLNVAQESAPKAIAFETYAGKATRVENAENSGMPCSYALEAHHANFLVWGYKNTATTKVFDNVEVSHDGAAWNYTIDGVTNGVYWDKSASKYEFYAAAPATASFWTLNANTDDKADDYFTTTAFSVTAHNATNALDNADPTQSFKGVANATDLMIANKEPNTAITGSVELDFMHILSRLNITVKETVPGPSVVKLVSLTVNGLGATASFDESKVADPSTGTYGRWGSEVAGVWTAGVTTSSVSYTALENQTVDATAKYVLEALVMPQAADHEVVLPSAASGTKPYITITYTIGNDGVDDEVFTATYNLAAAFDVTAGNTLAFNEGWQNTLNITIGADVISFSGKVAEWKDTSKNHTVGNN